MMATTMTRAACRSIAARRVLSQSHTASLPFKNTLNVKQQQRNYAAETAAETGPVGESATAADVAQTAGARGKEPVMMNEALRDMSDKELRKLFLDELTPIIREITLADKEMGYEPGDVWHFALGTHELKFKVVTAAMQRFGREIPNSDLSKIHFAKDLVNWFVRRVREETPRPTLQVPSNVKLFIDKNYRRRDLEDIGVLQPRKNE